MTLRLLWNYLLIYLQGIHYALKIGSEKLARIEMSFTSNEWSYLCKWKRKSLGSCHLQFTCLLKDLFWYNNSAKLTSKLQKVYWEPENGYVKFDLDCPMNILPRVMSQINFLNSTSYSWPNTPKYGKIDFVTYQAICTQLIEFHPFLFFSWLQTPKVCLWY